MAFEHYIRSGGRLLRCGYTTGTCAALAAAGAAHLLLTGQKAEMMGTMTPKGIAVKVPLEFCRLEGGAARCAVRKDAGDDIDATAGALIFATVEKTERLGIVIDGGEGVGRVTKPGLDQPVGEAAINSVPRQMIRQSVERVCSNAGYHGGLKVTISVPDGEAIAKKTFNPDLGIEGGISILGTSGIVEPMSLQAIVDTIILEINQAAAQGVKRIIFTPGNYGEDFLKSCGGPALDMPVIKCSNFIGEALDGAAAQGCFTDVLLVGHIGKLVKLAGGIMNTHSRWADCRTELFCAYAAICGAGQKVCAALMEAATADRCIAVLDEAGLRQQVLEKILAAIQRHLQRRADGAFRIGAVLFSNEYGFLGQTDKVWEMIGKWR